MIKTVYILWLRQIKRYWRNKSRIFGSLGQPILLLISLGFGMRATFAQAEGLDYISFLTPGIISQAIVFMAIFNGVELIWDKEFGFLKETLVAPVSRLSIVLGRVLGGATVASLQGLLVFCLTLFVGFKPINLWLVPVAFLVIFLISLLYASLGTAIAATMEDFHGFQLIMNFVVMPSFFLSGALFPLEKAPKALRMIASINPLTYGVDALRGLLVGVSSFSLLNNVLILGFITIFLLVLASYLFSRVEA
jgi:ABC-2 type transport system permease protein